ncbi:MAG: hypothetical protein K2W95_35520 [Candidatus Obscuribacterales bacterium]|nr:hypothetical protein [Candidatus Obscuribacterales bacterium]
MSTNAPADSAPTRKLTIAVVLRFFGSTPTILNADKTAYINDPEGHGIMRPVEIFNENGVGVTDMFGKQPRPTKEAPLVIYLDTNKNKGDAKGVLCDVVVVESGGPDTPWKLDIANENGEVSPVDYQWYQKTKVPLGTRDLSCTISFAWGRKADELSNETVVTGVLGIFREGPDAMRVEVPLKLVYRGPRLDPDAE